MRLIDANALHAKIYEDSERSYGAEANIAQVLLRIETAPTIEPEVRHGRWIELPKALNPEETPCKCSACGHILSFYGYYPKSNFCPRCGARMDGGADNG